MCHNWLIALGVTNPIFVHNRCGERIQGFRARQVKLQRFECELRQPTPVLHLLSREKSYPTGEKGYPTGELPPLPPAAQVGMAGGITHWGLCIPLNHSKPRAGSWFSSTCRFSSPSSCCPVPLQGSCHAQGPVCAHLSSPCQTAPSSRGKLFFLFNNGFHNPPPVLLPTDVPKLWLGFPCVATTACLCFVGTPDKEDLEGVREKISVQAQRPAPFVLPHTGLV